MLARPMEHSITLGKKKSGENADLWGQQVVLVSIQERILVLAERAELSLQR